MDVWSGLPGSCVRAPQPLNIETNDFAFAFFANETQPSQVKQEQPNRTAAVAGKPAVPCKVCGDKASGYHYGVTSCEGCKGFFRRSIQKKIVYRCLREEKCQVIRLNRNRCQFCRLKKCTSVGMSRDSVRYGRVSKKTKETITVESMPDVSRNVDAEANQAPQPDVPRPLRDPNDIVRDLAKVVINAHNNNNSYTAEVRAGLVLREIPNNPELPEGGSDLVTSGSSTVSVQLDALHTLWYNVAYRMTPSVQQVVEFAKRIPGFSVLLQDDQLIIIKLGFFEVWLSRAAKFSYENCIIFDDGAIVNSKQLIDLYDVPFATAMLTYVYNVHTLTITEDEMAIFTAILLMFPHRNGLCDTERIASINRNLWAALKLLIIESGVPNVDGRIEAFTLAAQEIQALGTRHNELLYWCRANWPSLVLPALFSEIFDIPKIEEPEAAELQPTTAAIAQVQI